MGQTTITLGASNSTLTTVTDPSCVGSQPYWFVWGPVILNVGEHTHQFIDIGEGDGFVESGPDVAQGGLEPVHPDILLSPILSSRSLHHFGLGSTLLEFDECAAYSPCDKRSTCEDLPLRSGWKCHCIAGYSGSTAMNGTDCIRKSFHLLAIF
jgi:hypothetical protein